MEQTNMAGILDLDMDAIVDPNECATPGKYRFTVLSAEVQNHDSGAVGVLYFYGIQTPGKYQGKKIRDLVNIGKKDGTENNYGTWHVKKLAKIKGVKKGKIKDLIPASVGAEFDAELDIEDNGDFGPQNVIKRIYE